MFPDVQSIWNRKQVTAKSHSRGKMAKESTQPGLSASQSLTTLVLYVALTIILAVTSLQFFRVAISGTLGVLRQIVRTFLYVTSWPIYLGLLPVRALIFLASLSIKVVFYGAMAVILYFLLCGTLNFEMVKDTFGAALQYL